MEPLFFNAHFVIRKKASNFAKIQENDNGKRIGKRIFPTICGKQV